MIYGHDKTIHGTKLLNVEVDGDGHVVGVWFRCMALPFDVTRVSPSRASDLRRMYEGETIDGHKFRTPMDSEIHAIDIRHPDDESEPMPVVDHVEKGLFSKLFRRIKA